MWGVLGRLVGLCVFVVGAVSGYLETVAPQSSVHPQWVPGLLVAAVALGLLLIAGWLRTVFDQDGIYAVFGLVALLVFVMVLPVHYGTHHALTIDVPIDTADGEIQLKQVRGHEYTSAAATARFLHGDLIDDEDLVRMLDGPSAVWTRESIEEYWRRVLVYYSLLVSSLIVAVVCLGVFIDGVVQERLEIRASAQFARMMARRRAARRRQG